MILFVTILLEPRTACHGSYSSYSTNPGGEVHKEGAAADSTPHKQKYAFSTRRSTRSSTGRCDLDYI